MRKVLIPTKLDKVVAQILGEHGFEVIQNPDAPLTELADSSCDACKTIAPTSVYADSPPPQSCLFTTLKAQRGT